ncbi:MAG: squalene/phytoene synthase family protein [Halorhabdus sp.]
MDAGRPPPDAEWCYEAVQGVSRTFALTVEALEEPMASQIGLGYLLCRIADTIEDAGHIPPEEQASLPVTARESRPSREARVFRCYVGTERRTGRA